MILFLGFKFGSIFFPHERKTVQGLFCLLLSTIGWMGQMTIWHTESTCCLQIGLESTC